MAEQKTEYRTLRFHNRERGESVSYNVWWERIYGERRPDMYRLVVGATANQEGVQSLDPWPLEILNDPHDIKAEEHDGREAMHSVEKELKDLYPKETWDYSWHAKEPSV